MRYNRKQIIHKRNEAAQLLPEDVKSAVELFMRFGDDTKGKAHNGYYSKGGWPYDILYRFLHHREEE